MRIAILSLCLSGLMLAGCSSRHTNGMADLRGLLQGDAPSERFVALFDEQAPAVELLFLRTQSVSRLLLSHENAGVLTWMSIEGATLRTRNGFIVGTNGFFEGLQAAHIDAVARLVLAERTGQAERLHTYLDGNNDISIHSYRCDIRPTGNEMVTIKGQTTPTRRIEERCGNQTDDFTNIYWVSNGAILQATQWIGPIAGALRTRQVDIYEGD